MADSARELYLKTLAKDLKHITSRAEYDAWVKAHPQYHFTYEELLEGKSLLEKEASEKKEETKSESHYVLPPPPQGEANVKNTSVEASLINDNSQTSQSQETTENIRPKIIKTPPRNPLRPPAELKQLPVLHSHRKEAEKILIHDWGEKYKRIEQEVTEEKRKQLLSRFQKEMEEHNKRVKNDFEKRDNTWVQDQVRQQLYYFTHGKHGTRGQFDPSGKTILTEIDGLVDERFKDKHQKEWYHAHQQNDPRGGKIIVPAQPSLTLRETEDKARELFPDIYKKPTKNTPRTIPFVPTQSTPEQAEEVIEEITETAQTPESKQVIPAIEEANSQSVESEQPVSPLPRTPIPGAPGPLGAQSTDDQESSQSGRSRTSTRQIRQGQRVANQVGKKLATRAGTQAALSGAGSLAGSAAGGAGGAAAGAGAGAGLPVIAVIVGIILLILLIIIILVVILGGGAASQIDNSLIPVSLTKTADKTEVPNPVNTDLTQPDPSDVTYTLNVSYPGRAQDVIVTDPIPPNSTFVKATGLHEVEKDASGRVLSVTWSLKANQSASVATTPTGATPGTGAKIDITKYTQPPYSLPAPNGDSNIIYTNQIMDNLNELGSTVSSFQNYLTSKFDPKYVDPFLAVIWTGAIEGSYGNPYSWNCQDLESGNTINNGCAGGFYSGGWQVAGIQVAQAANHMVDDFKAVYGTTSADDAAKVQEIGQAVITNSANSSAGQITNPSTFPHKSLPQLVSEAKGGDIASQQALAILLMDRKLGAIIVALEVAGDISSRDNWRATMEGWGSWYASNMQQFSNRMQAIAALYSGTGTSAGGNTFAARTFTLTVRPTLSDTYLVNRATARVVGAETEGESPTGSPGTVTGDIAKLLPDPLPADPANAAEIKASILAHFQSEKDTLIPMYKGAAEKSGIPWQVFAGIHWREGDALPGYSLTSGRPIGGYEPDRAAAGDCTGPIGAVDGKADTNCAFADGVDDILFVANHLKGKIGKTPSTFPELVTALSRYNGTGNVNCYQTPYTYCPPLFDGEDSPYALNFFDDRHSQMYLRYCFDGQLCDYGTRDNRPGAATVTKWVAGSGL